MIKILELDKRIGSSMWTTNHRFIDPITMAGIVTGAGALGSSIVSTLGATQMSKAQLAQQKELFHTNWNNTRIENAMAFRRSADFEREMFNAENMYNSPIELMRRLEAAGINPQVAINGALGSASSQSASAGNAVSPASTPGGVPQLPREFSPFEGIGQGLAAATGNIAQLLKTKAEINELNTRADKNTSESGLAKSQTTEQDFLNTQLEKTLDSIIDATNAKLQADIAMDDFRLSFAVETANINQQILRNKLAYSAKEVITKAAEGDKYAAEAALYDVRKDFESEQYAFFKKQQPKLMEELQAKIDKIGEEIETERTKQGLNRSMQYSYDELAKKTSAEKWSIIENSITLYEDEYGVHMSKSKREEVKKELFKQMQEHTKQEQKKTRQMGQDYWNPFNYIGKTLGGSGNVNVVKAIK